MSSHHETLSTSFPGPRLAGIACILAPILLMGGAYFLHPTDPESTSTILSYRPDASRVGLGLNLFMTGVVFAAFAGIALARLVAAKAPRIASVGGFLVVAWAASSPFFGGVQYVDVPLAGVVDDATARAVGEATGFIPIPVLVGTIGLLAGWTTLAVGAWRTGVFGIVQGLGLATMSLVPVAVAFAGQPALAAVAFLGMGIALVPLGIDLVRGAAASAAEAERRAPA